MGLTQGAGPFGEAPRGRFGGGLVRPPRAVYAEDYPRRVRVELGGETVADSERVLLVHETGLLPVYYFPEADVRTDLLSPAGRGGGTPALGEPARWTVRAGERVADAAGWSFPEAAGDAALVAGHYSFAFEAMDAWYEEDDPVLGHPPDPYHRIDVRRTGREVRVRVDGVPVARSTAARLLFETGLPTRYYLPRSDVDPEVLVPSDTHTRCAYKGVASYLSVQVGGRVHRDVVWFYPDPALEGRPVRDLLCFFNERAAVQVEVDGKPVERAWSMWEGEEIPPAPTPR